MNVPPTVLLIEDDDASRELFAHALTSAGWTVRAAGDGLSGLRILDIFTPAVIVLDMVLPAASGLHVLDQLKVRACTAPVVAISGHESGLETARAHDGVLALIRKPFTADELVRTVERARAHAAT